MIREKAWFSVVYMFFVTMFFSSVVIGFASFTRDRVEANRRLDFERSVLEVFSLAEGKSNVELHDTFVEKVKPPVPETGGAWYLMEGDEISGFAVSVEGKGFWATIKGVMGVAGDGVTVTGISFYEQNETPGLGGEIIKAKFRDQFIGKKINGTGRAIGIMPFGSELGDNEVHAISGATQTCIRLEKIINESVSAWLKKVSEWEGGQ